MSVVNAITPMQMKLYMKHYEYSKIPEGRYLAQMEENKMFIALIRRKNYCFIEEFGTYLEAVLWIKE